MTSLKELLEQKAQIETKLEEISRPLMNNLTKINDQINELALKLLTEPNNPGTYNLETDGVKVKAVIGKTVKWDQTKLATLYDRIAGSGDDPHQYMARELKISENAYKGWPEQIKNVFIPARTVTPTKPKFEFTVADNNNNEIDDIPF